MQEQKTAKITVVIRKRPLIKKELNGNDLDIVEVMDKDTIIVRELKEAVDLRKYIEEHKFVLDKVFDGNVGNYELYTDTIQPLVKNVFNKTKVTCFAYGQTGSGKTYTMMGNSKEEG